NLERLKPEDVDPHLAFHCGLPSSVAMLAYDPAQKILAISTKFIGDRVSNVTMWKLNKGLCQIEKMNYWIPFSSSNGCTNKVDADNAVMYILPQPTAESKRCIVLYSLILFPMSDNNNKTFLGVLLKFYNGLITLWEILESKAVFTIGGNETMAHLPSNESKRVTAACWVYPSGSKVAIGYDTGDILIYPIPTNSLLSRYSSNTHNVHTSKINLGYRLEKVPIGSLIWMHSDGKANQLYVIGASDATSTSIVQVVLLNEDTKSRTIKVGIQLPEQCHKFEIISCLNDQNKHKQHLLQLLGKFGLMYAYDDHSIEKCLLQSQSKSLVSLPNEMIIKLPFSNSKITSS
ncbi:Gag-Pol polyprotein, partial [Bienertia sinuspersici]